MKRIDNALFLHAPLLRVVEQFLPQSFAASDEWFFDELICKNCYEYRQNKVLTKAVELQKL
jgi:hypothetical protein